MENNDIENNTIERNNVENNKIQNNSRVWSVSTVSLSRLKCCKKCK